MRLPIGQCVKHSKAIIFYFKAIANNAANGDYYDDDEKPLKDKNKADYVVVDDNDGSDVNSGNPDVYDDDGGWLL